MSKNSVLDKLRVRRLADSHRHHHHIWQD